MTQPQAHSADLSRPTDVAPDSGRGLLRTLVRKLSRSGEGAAPSAGEGWVPFDEQRRESSLRRADIVFGPDMFDPRTDNGDRPLTDAIQAGRSDLDPADLSKTAGELLGEDASAAEIRDFTLKNSHSITLHDDTQP